VLLANGTILVTGGITGSNSNNAVTATAEIYNPLTNSWTATTNMTTARVGHTTTLLGSGKVLVTGGCAMTGCGFAAPPLGAEIYDPQAQTWTPTGPMALPRTNASATLLANGQVLVAGGLDSGSYAISAAEVFNPLTASWTATGSMTTARFQPSATLLGDGTVLVANGVPAGSPGKPTAELYNPANGLWVATGSPSTYSFTLTALSPSSVLASGGTLASQKTTGRSLLYTSGPAPLVSYSPTSLNFGDRQVAVPSAAQIVTVTNLGTLPLHPGSPQLTGSAKGDYSASGSCVNATVASGASCTLSVVFTPSANGVRDASMAIPDDAPTSPQIVPLAGFGYTEAPHHWIPAGSMSAARDPVTLSRLPNGNVLAVGGVINGPPTSADIYNATTNSWSPAPAMSTFHSGGTATTLPDGRILIAGGGTSVAEIYNPRTNRWLTTGPMTESRQYAAASLLPSGQVLVTGGCTGTLPVCTSTEIYNPATNAWTPAAALLTARSSHTSTLLKTGQVLIAGGISFTGGPFQSAELYDPVQNTFTYTGSMAVGHTSHTASLLANGDVLVAGGFQGTSVPGSAEIYTPSTGLWTTTGAMHISRQDHTASVLSNGSVLVAGGLNYCDEDGCTATSTAEIYNVTTGAWTFTNSMMSARQGHGAVLLKGGAVLVAGGDDGINGDFWSTAEQYVP
jgi:N-acetylneuraminic acid mutarotase